MKVLKFGGSSVGSVESILKVKEIILSQKESVIVVASALGGVTDSLIQAAEMAKNSQEDFRSSIEAMKERHLDMVRTLHCSDSASRRALESELEALFSRLSSLCEGVFLLEVLPKKALDEIVSFGERLSCLILSSIIPSSKLYDSLRFIRTCNHQHGAIVESGLTFSLIRAEFDGFEKSGRIAIVPGFIASDAVTSEITNLGRGGSDYSASLIASALKASVLEIWTDVDGFMTADPRIIATSYVIDEMSYAEAMELCNFGAKVVYPTTLYPVCREGIPILIKNTFNPQAPGTTIKKDCKSNGRSIKGISSIDDICLLTLSGTSLVGVVGIDSRIFTTLTKEGVSAFLVSQSASETGISIGVSREDAPKAKELLSQEFSAEIASGSIDPIRLQYDLAAVAVVGEEMKDHPGAAGRLFTTLGRSGVSVIALAQGAAQSNISIIIERVNLRKALNVIHDSFFLSEYQELNLFICGIGTVGGKLIDQISAQKASLMKERNLKINIVGIARSTRAIFDREGIDTATYRERLESGMEINPTRLRDEIIRMNIFNPVFVDCTASSEIASLYEDLFNAGVSVVAANKIAASSDYDNYLELKHTALRRNVKFLFETNVGAGLPIINTINDLRNSGDRIIRLEAVLSGTLNFIFNTLSKDIPFSRAVRMAMEQGYSEPDPRIDLCGKDVMRKLVILSREAGYKVSQEDVHSELFIPQEFFDCSMEEFWQKLPSLDEGFEEQRLSLEKQGRRWRFVAEMNNGQCKVSLKSVDRDHSFYVLDGSNNIILLTTERYRLHPMLIQGYGAGADVTAAGVFADIMSIANI